MTKPGDASGHGAAAAKDVDPVSFKICRGEQVFHEVAGLGCLHVGLTQFKSGGQNRAAVQEFGWPRRAWAQVSPV